MRRVAFPTLGRAARPATRALAPAALLAALLATLAACAPTPPTSAPAAAPSVSRVTRPGIGFRSRERLLEHYDKHGVEFGSPGVEAYLQLAQQLRDAPAGGPIVERVRHDGVITRFDRDSGAFLAADPDGTIRTFFKPRDGLSYFERQADRE